MDKAIRFVEALVVAAIGFLVAWALDAANGWWLNSGSGVLRTSLVLTGLGLFATVWPFGRPLTRAAALWAGAIVAMAILLFRSGPGTIWPIVLVVAAAITAGAVFAGALTGWLLSKRLRLP